MGVPTLFVSFSSGDREAMRRLFARLEAQPVRLWNYADEEQEIRGGESISEHLRRRIDRSDVFLAIVTANSFRSAYTRLEVAYALERVATSALRIIPLVAAGAPTPADWPAPYDRLAARRYREADFLDRESLERMIIALCADVGARHVPLPTLDPRLPFMDRFEAEIRQKCPHEAERDLAIYGRLMAVLTEFQAAFEAGRYRRARSRIAFFVLMCEREFPRERFYYPYVVRGVCEMACGQLRAATETFVALKDHPALDENVFGGLGWICHQQGMYREALDHYRQAAARDNADPAARAGVLLNALLCGEDVDVRATLEAIDPSTVVHEEDRAKLEALRAFALAHAGSLDEAIAIYDSILRRGRFDADTLANFALALERHGRPRQARDLLLRFHAKFPDPNLLHRLASLSFRIDDFALAARHFAALVRQHPWNRQYRIDAAQVFWRVGEREHAQELCAPLLDPRSFPLPQTPSDFYCDGFANWLHHRIERAEYDFARSGRPPEDHYRHVMAALA